MSGGYAAPPSGSMSGAYGMPTSGSMSGGYAARYGAPASGSMSGAYGMPTSGSMSGGYAAREQAPCDGLLGCDGTCYSYCGKYKTGIDIGGTCKGKTCAGMWSANNCNAIAQIVGCTWSGSLCQDSGCHGAPAS